MWRGSANIFLFEFLLLFPSDHCCMCPLIPCRNPGLSCSSCSCRANSLWAVLLPVVCTSSMRGQPSAGCACSWLQLSAGFCPGRLQSFVIMSALCMNCTARRDTVASALACSPQAALCCPWWPGPHPSLSLWLCWQRYPSLTNSFCLQPRH